jgi:cytosine/adenosine deaminase-related metal-dependent hydrolase
LESGALYIEDDRIVDVGSYGEITGRHKAEVILGSQDHIVVPGFVNAHSHGKGLTDFQRGNIDDTLETWKFYNYPPVDREYDTRWAVIKYLEAGITAGMHNHALSRPELHTHEFEAIIDVYREYGMKVAFAPMFSNQNWFVYGDNEAFVDSLPADVRQVCRGIMEKAEIFGPEEYLKAVHRLYQKYKDDGNVQIMHGPLSPQWVDDDTLRAIAKDASRKNLRTHIHVQQTKLQKLYGLKKYGSSLLAHLDDLGLLGQDTTIGHAVWVSEEDIALLAARGSSVTHHATCNFRVRNGIAPVYALLQAGVHVGLGLDDKEFGDSKDFIEEMRLISKLHRLPSHKLDSPHLQPVDAFTMATLYGAETLGWENSIGSLEIGKSADMVLLDARRMTEPFVSPDHSPVDLLVYRGGSRDVDMVLANGDLVVEKGKITVVDREEVAAKLRESLPADYSADFERRHTVLRKLRPYIAEWFAPWYDEMEGFEGEAFYHLNNRK